MKEMRERIDSNLDRLQARATRSRKPVALAALAGGVLVSALFLLAKRRKARKARAA